MALAGEANADTRGNLGAGLPEAHAASFATYIVSYPSPTGPPGWVELPPPVVDDASVTISGATLKDGTVARVTTPVSAYGMARVEWIKAGSYFQMLSDHGGTLTQGVTGISGSDLLSLANSVS